MARQIPKLNVAWAEHPARVRIDSSEWSRIEDAYGSPIPNALREEIQSLTNRFLEFGVFELTAAPVADAIRRITKLNKAASGLFRELGKSRADDAVIAADRTIQRHLRRMSAENPHTFESVADMVSYFITACGKAAAELEERKSSGFKDREHWRLWVHRVQMTLKKHGLQAGIRKDREGNTGWQASAFVRLIKALQDCIPPEYRYRANSEEALSAAISKACREMRPPGGGQNTRRSAKPPQKAARER